MEKLEESEASKETLNDVPMEEPESKESKEESKEKCEDAAEIQTAEEPKTTTNPEPQGNDEKESIVDEEMQGVEQMPQVEDPEASATLSSSVDQQLEATDKAIETPAKEMDINDQEMSTNEVATLVPEAVDLENKEKEEESREMDVAKASTEDKSERIDENPKEDENVRAEAADTPFQTDASNNPSFSGLSMLAQYDSASDSEAGPQNAEDDDIVEVSTQYRDKVVEINSDSSSDSNDSDVEYLSEIRKQIDKRIGQANEDFDSDEDDEDGNGNTTRKIRAPPKVKGEFLLEDLPPIEDLHITVPEEVCVELGKVHSIVDKLVLVNTLPNSVLLDLETVLFLEKGKKVLGNIFDVLGQVSDPLYCIRFNSNEQIVEKGIQIGDVVYVAPETEHTQFIVLSSIMKMKGSDASWEHDVEPPARFLDYSDDEEERVARGRLRNKKRTATGETIVVADDDSDNDCKFVPTTRSNNPPNVVRNPAYSRDRPNPRQRQSNTNPNPNNPGHYQSDNPNAYYGQRQNYNQRNDSWHNNYSPMNSNYRQNHYNDQQGQQYHPHSQHFNNNNNFNQRRHNMPYQNRHPGPSSSGPMPPMFNPYGPGGGVMPPSLLQMPMNTHSAPRGDFQAQGNGGFNGPPFGRAGPPPHPKFERPYTGHGFGDEPPPPGE